MQHFHLLDVVIFIFVTCIGGQSSELRYMPRRHRDHAFSSGVYYRESLTWVVKLNLSLLNDEDVGDAADAVAADSGLHNRGQIDNLDGYYVFSHPAAWSSIFHRDKVMVLDDVHQRIQDQIHEMFDNHPFVEWYMLQRVVPRFKRTVHLLPRSRKLPKVPSRRPASKKSSKVRSGHSSVKFNDPFYHKQWHLVGPSFFVMFSCYCIMHGNRHFPNFFIYAKP